MDMKRWIKSEIEGEFVSNNTNPDDKERRKEDGSPITFQKRLLDTLPVEMKTCIRNNSYIGLYYRVEPTSFSRALETSLEENKKEKRLVDYSKSRDQEISRDVYVIHMLNDNKDRIEVCHIAIMQFSQFKDCAVIITSSNDVKWSSFVSKIREYARQMV